MLLQKNTARRRRGFTLPEIMIALGVLAFAVTIFGTAFPTASRAVARSNNMDIAVNLCDHQLEVYRDGGYAACEPATGQSTRTVTFTPPTTIPNGTGTVTFTRVDDSYQSTSAYTGRVLVEATVRWRGMGRDIGTVTLSTLVCEPNQ
jgi:prepilin-type N-terminal cleavage/methylation domain-containing protein